MQATYDGYFACQSVVYNYKCMLLSLDSGVSMTATFTGAFEGGCHCQTLTPAILDFLFHFSLFAASSLNLRMTACFV